MSQFKKSGSPHELRVDCPYCGDTKGHCYLNTQHHVFFCFRCGCHGTEVQLKKKLRIPVSIQESEPKIQKPVDKSKYVEISGTNMLQRAAKKYWYSRGFTDVELLEYKVKFNPERLTLVIPLLDEKTGLVAFDIERSIFSNDEMKYYIEPGAKKQEYLFNLDKAKTKQTIFLVEGTFDAMAIKDFEGVAILGKFLSDVHIRKLKDTNIKTIGICLDADAVYDSYTVLNQLLPYFEVSLLKISETGYKDISELREKEGIVGVDKFLKMSGCFTTGM